MAIDDSLGRMLSLPPPRALRHHLVSHAGGAVTGPRAFSSMAAADRQARCLLEVAAHLLGPSPIHGGVGTVPVRGVEPDGGGSSPARTDTEQQEEKT